jgi:hydroxymethylbilane synthase
MAGRVDVAIHSLKDVPTVPVPGLVLAGILERGEPRDVFVGRNGVGLAALPAGARVGTSSTRREAMVRAARPDVDVAPLRGNVDSRLRRVAEGEIDGAILAGAGLIRLGRQADITEWLEIESFLPAPGQGAIALECRADDREVLALLSLSDHSPTRAAVTAERAFLAVQGENCALPVGAFATVTAGQLRLRGTLSGSPAAAQEAAGDAAEADAIGARLGRAMRASLGGAA